MATPHVCFADMPQYTRPYGSAAEDDDQHETAITQRHRKERQLSSSSSPNSISPTPTPRYERNMGFFQQLSRRFGLRSNDDLVYDCSAGSGASVEDDARSSSTDSYSSIAALDNAMLPQSQPQQRQRQHQLQPPSMFCNNSARCKDAAAVHNSSLEHISCASSETSSTVDIEDQQQQQCINAAATAGLIKERKSSTRSSFSRLHRRSTSSIRRAFESFSLSSRSLSCSSATPPPQRNAVTSSGGGGATGAISSGCSNGNTPIKSALKSSSNMELHKKAAACASSSSSSSASSKSSSKSKVKPPPQRILRQPVSYTYLKGISGLPTQRVPRSSVCCQYARR